MATPLRIYIINREEPDALVREFREQIRPLRGKSGFEIDGALCVPETNPFVRLMRYDGPEDRDTLDRSFHTHAIRRSMQPDPARNIARASNHFLEPVGPSSR